MKKETIIQSKTLWKDTRSVVTDINEGRKFLQALGFVYKEPTLITPKHIYEYLTTKGFYPQDMEFTHLDFLLNNSLIENVISVESTENIAYLGVYVYDYQSFPKIEHKTAGVTITDINLCSEQKEKHKEEEK